MHPGGRHEPTDPRACHPPAGHPSRHADRPPHPFGTPAAVLTRGRPGRGGSRPEVPQAAAPTPRACASAGTGVSVGGVGEWPGAVLLRDGHGLTGRPLPAPPRSRCPPGRRPPVAPTPPARTPVGAADPSPTARANAGSPAGSRSRSHITPIRTFVIRRNLADPVHRRRRVRSPGGPGRGRRSGPPAWRRGPGRRRCRGVRRCAPARRWPGGACGRSRAAARSRRPS